MKIPEGIDFTKAEKAWHFAAAQIGIEYGIIVTVGKDMEAYSFPVVLHTGASLCNSWRPNRIFFILDGHEFETLPELKRAIELKVFL